jgi:glycogen synthase
VNVRRVLMTADAVGGVWTYCLHLAAGLAQAGVAIDLAVLGPPPDDAQRTAAAQIPRLTLWPAAFRLEWMEDAARDVVRSGEWLLALAARTAPDVVHLNGFAHGALAFPASKVVMAHSCVLSWWRAVHGCAPPEAWRGYAEAVCRGLAGADRVLAPSAAMLRALDTHYGPRSAPSSVIANGLPWPRLVPGPKRPLVFAAGRLWDAGKNIASLAAVAPTLAWPVIVAGDGAVSGAQASDGVRHLGRLDAEEMDAALRRAAIYALPARYEPFGLSILEAAQRGCALVLGDIESLRENWTGAAVFVPPDDVDELGRTIRRLIAEPETRRALGSSARRRARRFSAQKMCQATLRLYEEVVAGLEPVPGRTLTAGTSQKGAETCAS